MTHNVMFVDDAKTMQQLVTYTLEEAGFNVTTASSAEEALGIIASGKKLSMLITDLNMPGMNGIELIRALRSTPGYRFTPAAVLSTESEHSRKEQARQAGASFWMVKPFTPEQLVTLVGRFVR